MEDRSVAAPADAGHRGRAQVQAPEEVGCPEGPGHRRLDRRDVAHDDDVAVWAPSALTLRREELLADGGDPLVHLGQRLPARWPERTIAPPLLPDRGRDGAEGLTLELPVVDLDPAVVDDGRKAQPEERRGVAGPAERARAQV